VSQWDLRYPAHANGQRLLKRRGLGPGLIPSCNGNPDEPLLPLERKQPGIVKRLTSLSLSLSFSLSSSRSLLIFGKMGVGRSRSLNLHFPFQRVLSDCATVESPEALGFDLEIGLQFSLSVLLLYSSGLRMRRVSRRAFVRRRILR